MDSAMRSHRDSATLVTAASVSLSQRLQNVLGDLIVLVRDYHTQPLTPAATFAFEKKSRTGCAKWDVK